MKSIVFYPLLVIVLTAILEIAPSCCHADDNVQSIQQKMLMLDNRWLNRWFNRSSIDKGVSLGCCHSETLQGTINRYDMNSPSMTVTQFYHDAWNCRLALIDTNPFLLKTGHRTVVQCYSGQICIVSVISDQLKHCTQKIHTGASLDSFWQRCTPKGAILRQNLTMGGDKNPLKLQMWNFFGNGEASTISSKVVTEKGCFPVAEVKITGSGKATNLNVYFDVKSSSITTSTAAKVFDVPHFCHGPIPRK